MIINTDYDELLKELTVLQRQINAYNLCFASVNEQLNIHCVWTGKDQKKYKEQSALLKQNIEKMVKNIEALAQDVNNAAAKYKEAASIIAPHAGRI
ncbi:MAG: hypothetical protein E7554_05940 [Ruminococcaceae bacterium]|nr:hypothetical protein [Oscillospiraceae bacterium]